MPSEEYEHSINDDISDLSKNPQSIGPIEGSNISNLSKLDPSIL